MTLLEFAKKASPIPLTAFQKEFLQKYEEAVNEDKVLICSFPPRNGRTILKDIVNQYYGQPPIDVYCHGTKKKGIPCKRYLGKVEGKAELLCPICKTVNVVENGKVNMQK